MEKKTAIRIIAGFILVLSIVMFIDSFHAPSLFRFAGSLLGMGSALGLAATAGEDDLV